MLKHLRRFSRWAGKWPRFCALLTLLFLARGALVLSVQGPFDGWDEYQHVAYLVFLKERGRAPVMNDDNMVPRSMYADLVRFPHCALAVRQIGDIGAVGYGAFWASDAPPRVRPDAPAIRLYQAQQAPLYYRLVSPLYEWLYQRGGMLAAVTGLRALNVLFGAAAVWIALWTVGRIVLPGAPRCLLGLLIALQPLFLVNCARVANDALAVLLGTIAVALLLTLPTRRIRTASLAAGLALGLGILAKTIDLSLLPFAVFVFVRVGRRGRLSWRQAALGLGVFLVAMIAVCGSYFVFNLRQFGLLTPLQEALTNRAAGRFGADLLDGLSHGAWWGDFAKRFGRHALWFGGWNWLKSPARLMDVHQGNILLAMAGGLFALRASVRRRACLFAAKHSLAEIGVLCLGVAAGLGYHALHTHLAYGAFAANSWYACVSFPWLLCLFVQGIACLPRAWMARLIGAAMLGVYLIAEIWGTLMQMVRAQTGEAWGPVARGRLAALHLPGLGPGLTAVALAVMLTLVALCVVVCWGCKEARLKPAE